MEHCSCNMYQCRSASDGAECLCVGGCLSDSHGTSIGHSFRRWHCQPDTEADTIAGSDGKTQSGYLFEKCTSGYYINRGGSR